MPKRVLMPLASRDFDPTEVAVPWRVLTNAGVEVVFATADGRRAEADPIMVTGRGLGPLKWSLRADARGRAAYAEMIESPAFKSPRALAYVAIGDFDGLVLHGGHAPGMRAYLEDRRLQQLVVEAFERDKAVGAICHGVVVAARARRPDGRSVLHGRRTTSLLDWQEYLAWWLTRLWMGDYYRTYRDRTVEGEVRAALRDPRADFAAGPFTNTRDSLERLDRGFVVRDGRYVSARWPGDAHRFAKELLDVLG